MKRLLSFLIAVSISVCCITGCNENKNSNIDTSSKTESNPVTEATTTQNETVSTTASVDESSNTDPNGYLKQIVGIWESDDDPNINDIRVFTEDGKAFFCYTYHLSIMSSSNNNEFDYRIDDNKIEITLTSGDDTKTITSYIIEASDNKLKLNDEENKRYGSRQYHRVNKTVEEIREFNKAHYYADSVWRAINDHKSLSDNAINEPVPVASYAESKEPSKLAVYDILKDCGLSDDNLGYIYYCKVINGGEEFLYVQWSQEKQGSIVGQYYRKIGEIKFDTLMNTTLGKVPQWVTEMPN